MQLSSSQTDGYVDGAWGPITSLRGRSMRLVRPGSARVLLPLHWPDAGRLDLAVMASPGVTGARLGVTVNGMALGMHDVGDQGAQSISFEIPPGVTHHGINEVWLWVEGGPIGVATLTVRDGEPPPSAAQRRRNAELLERRRRERLGGPGAPPE